MMNFFGKSLVGSDVEKYAMKKLILFIATILTLCSSVARADNLEDGGGGIP